ncbi:hypothetical protein Sste5346_004790 [Sporothrix stenoceras]|uniref:DUF642 domain-containing protein n=1 Tax=Sporothrix stenoceras TaxID=5173 RepID=A0ABR3Z7K1_9PEZI
MKLTQLASLLGLALTFSAPVAAANCRPSKPSSVSSTPSSSSSASPSPSCNPNNLVVNGDFSAGSLAGWTSSTNVGYLSGPGYYATEAEFDVDADGTGSLSQSSLVTVVGTTYTLSFSYFAPEFDSSNSYFSVHVNGPPPLLSVVQATPQSYTGTFVATSTSTTVGFTVVAGSEAVLQVSNVQVYQVCEGEE